MNKITFSNNPDESIGLLIKESSLNKSSLIQHYIAPIIEKNIPIESVAGYSLCYPTSGNKPSVKLIKEYLSTQLLPTLQTDNIETLLVCDAEYFKVLTGKQKAEVHLGYVLPCVMAGFEYLNIILGSSYTSLFHNPGTQTKINQSITTLSSFFHGKYLPPGSDIFKYAELVKDLKRIDEILAHLMTLPAVTADIETLSLHVRDAGICSIAFAEDKEKCWSFAVDTHLGLGKPVRERLKNFFINYPGKVIWHNAGYDIKILVYNLWMKNPLDRVGMLEGIDLMTRNFEDTKLIAYLALNSCSRSSYSLKVLAHEFAGNYAEQNINDATLIAPDDLLMYNNVDAMATWYVFDKYYQKMIDDQQLDLYEGLFKDSVRLILEIELVGMPINMDKVKFAKKELETIRDTHLKLIESSSIIKQLNQTLQQKACDAKQAKLKVKVVTVADFADVKFNPGSGKQLQELLFTQLNLPILDFTKKKKPATGAKTLSKLKKHTNDPTILELLDAFIGFGKASKILNTFIPAFEQAWLKPDGCYYLHGNFNLGFVVSGRLSSSKPNMQNLPSGSVYGKLIKDCFYAPKGWVMGGADFWSLEDRINALTTKDPNKLKVYTDGYDGHSLRAFAYYPSQMPDIIDTVASINSIQTLYEALRSRSKAPTFALTYQGTYITLMKNCGFTEQEAKSVEKSYHELYQVSDQWVQDKLVQASKDGYVTCAFGLRVRTPLLAKVLYGSSSKIPYEAQAEARTAGNALGQSYGLLNNRAACELRKRLKNSPYRLDVFLISLIHDATYVIMRDDIEVVEWVSRNIAECMAWQDLPEIQHSDVGLGGELDVMYKSWKNPITIKNGLNKDEILTLIKEEVSKINSLTK